MSTFLTKLSEDESTFKREVSKFAVAEVAPRVAHMDEAERLDADLIPQMFEMGLMGIEIPEKYNGAGGSFFQSILAIEALSEVDPSVGVFCDVQNTLVNNIFLRHANEEQRGRFLPRLATKDLGSYCLTEPNSGSDAFALKTVAREDGDHYVIEGRKIFITTAAEAKIYVVFATINPEAGYKGVTAFIVERDMPGFSIGKREKKLGIRASSTCEVILEKVRVPKTNIVGQPGKGYKIAIEALNEGRIGIAAQMLGLAQGAFRASLQYSQQREQFGKKLKDFQGIQFQLATMAVDIETARLCVYNAARLKDADQTFIKEAAIAKYHCSQVAERVASLALEIFGGYGFIREFPAEKFYRDAKIGKLYEGTSNMQLSTIFKIIDSGE